MVALAPAGKWPAFMRQLPQVAVPPPLNWKYHEAQRRLTGSYSYSQFNVRCKSVALRYNGSPIGGGLPGVLLSADLRLFPYASFTTGPMTLKLRRFWLLNMPNEQG